MASSNRSSVITIMFRAVLQHAIDHVLFDKDKTPDIRAFMLEHLKKDRNNEYEYNKGSFLDTYCMYLTLHSCGAHILNSIRLLKGIGFYVKNNTRPEDAAIELKQICKLELVESIHPRFGEFYIPESPQYRISDTFLGFDSQFHKRVEILNHKERNKEIEAKLLESALLVLKENKLRLLADGKSMIEKSIGKIILLGIDTLDKEVFQRVIKKIKKVNNIPVEAKYLV
jgi:hypothetical protein